jgi:hypothetical protein
MKSSAIRIASPAAVLALAGFVATGLTGTIPALPKVSDTLAKRAHGGKVTIASALEAIAERQANAQAQPQAAPFFQQKITPRDSSEQAAAPGAPQPARKITLAKVAKPDPRYYNQLRSQLRWVDVKYGGSKLRTPDPVSRLMLAQSAAQRAGLHEVGLSYRDVYGIINAETSWIPRMGASKNGTPNLGIAQFEPATAKALGLKNPHDPVEAIHVAALHLKHAAVWSARKLEGLNLPPQVHAAKLREGVSIFYNLSVKGRNKWDGTNTDELPIETQRHISNAARGAKEAATIEARMREFRRQERLMVNDSRNPAGGMLRTGG